MSDGMLSEEQDRSDGDNVRLRDDQAAVAATIRASRPPWLIALPVALLLLTGSIIYLAARPSDEARSAETAEAEAGGELQSQPVDEEADSEEAGAAANDGAESEGTEATTADDDARTITVETEAEAAARLPEPPADGPYVDATLTDNIFVLSGVVPDEETKLAIEAGAELAYAPFHTSNLEVDGSVGSADWLPSAPLVVGLLPMITDGTIRLQEGSATLVGRSPNQRWADEFAGAVGSLTGLEVNPDGIQLTGLVPPRFVATVANGEVLLEGEIPNQQILESFIGGAAAVYGAENVTSTMTVDEGTYTSFWNYTIPGVLQLLQPFPSYMVQVDDAVLSGNMQGAVLFELNSAEISDQAQQFLPIGIALMARDLNLQMTVIGHTDDTGPDDLNRRLSLERAQSVVDFFVANGVDSQRLTAEGAGPAEPIAPNDTDEGRALNRRVEFVFGSVAAGG